MVLRNKENYGIVYIGNHRRGIRNSGNYVWRIVPSGNDLLIQRYDVSINSWVTKSTITG